MFCHCSAKIKQWLAILLRRQRNVLPLFSSIQLLFSINIQLHFYYPAYEILINVVHIIKRQRFLLTKYMYTSFNISPAFILQNLIYLLITFVGSLVGCYVSPADTIPLKQPFCQILCIAICFIYFVCGYNKVLFYVDSHIVICNL